MQLTPSSLRPHQHEILQNARRSLTTGKYLFVYGGKGTFKTSTLVLSLMFALIGLSRKYAGIRFIVACMTYQQLRDVFIEQWRDQVPPNLYKFNENTNTIKFYDFDTEIWLRHSGDHREARSSEKASRIRRGANAMGYYFPQAESLSETFFHEIDSRIRATPYAHDPSSPPFKFIRWLDANPESKNHWLYKFFLDEQATTYIGDKAIIQRIVTTHETSAYSKEQLEIAAKITPNHIWMRHYEAEWVDAASPVFEDVQLVDAPIPKAIQKFWVGIDPGTANASDEDGKGNLAVVFVGYDGKRWIVLESMLLIFKGVMELADKINERAVYYGLDKFEGIVKDWSGGSGAVIETELGKYITRPSQGIWVKGSTSIPIYKPASKTSRKHWYSISAGVNLLYNSFKNGYLVVSRDAMALRNDLSNYVFDSRGEPDKKAYDAHLLDALRYAWIRITRSEQGGSE